MGKYRSYFKVFSVHFMKWKRNARLISVITLLFVIAVAYFLKIPFYGFNNGLSCTPFLVSILFSGSIYSNGAFKVLFFFIAVLMFSRAPFLDDQAYYLILRTGRKKWLFGGILYLTALALILLGILWLICICSVIPCMESTPGNYGSLVMKFLSDATLKIDDGVMRGWYIDARMVFVTDPFRSSLIVSGIVFLELIILSLIIECGNLYFPRKNAGIFAAVFLVLLDPVLIALTGDSSRFLLAFSPVSWCSLNMYRQISGNGILTVNLVLTESLGLIILLLGLIIRKVKRMDIVCSNADN